MKTKLISATLAAIALSTTSQATILHLADTVTTVGGIENQSFGFTNNSGGFANGDTITSGVTTYAEAFSYEALPQTSTGTAITNGRFNTGSFGTVSYNYTGGLTLDGLLFWNYNEDWTGNSYNERGITRADITITHDGGSLVLDDEAFTLTTNTFGLNTTAQNVDFGTQLTGVTQITFSDLQGNDSNFRGWQAVAAYGADVVPEPSSTALLSLGGLAMLLRRRR